MEDDDLLQVIHLRLPPQPPYLLRASLVCKRWRRLTTDPKLLRRFRIHHRRPPVLGFFSSDYGVISFRSKRFSLRVDDHEDWRLLECRHGRVLLVNNKQRQIMVWDPITGDQRLVAVPPEFYIVRTGAVLCAAGDQGHVHGSCHSSPFKVVLLCINKNYDQAVDINIVTIDTESPVMLLHYAEDMHAIPLHVHPSIFMLHLESMQSRELFKHDGVRTYHPFTSFYT